MSKKICTTCKYEHQIATLKDEIKRNSEQHKEFHSRLEECHIVDAVTDEKYQTILNVLTELKNQVKTLTETPNRRWETLITCIITGIVGFVIAYFFRV